MPEAAGLRSRENAVMPPPPTSCAGSAGRKVDATGCCACALRPGRGGGGGGSGDAELRVVRASEMARSRNNCAEADAFRALFTSNGDDGEEETPASPDASCWCCLRCCATDAAAIARVLAEQRMRRALSEAARSGSASASCAHRKLLSRSLNRGLSDGDQFQHCSISR